MRVLKAIGKMLLLPLLFLAPLTLAACSPPDAAPQRVVEPRPFDEPARRNDALMRRTMLTMHNDARRAVGMADLTWDTALARDAQAYAQQLARTGRFEHSPQPRGNPNQGPNQGENLWTGTRDAYRYTEMAQHWIDERRDFVNRPVPGASRTGKFGDVGHYTQIVWRTTTHVGCGFASNRRDDYLVCRYTPAGNVFGQQALP